MFELHRGECRQVMAAMEANSVDSMVTDPPYGLSKQPDIAEVMRHWLAGDDYKSSGRGFMGKSWDSFVPGPATWREAYRVLKPGGYALVFAGSRTQDLMSMALRLAGFEIRDTAFWLYGVGFPKSLDISKAVEKAHGIGASRERALKFTAWMRSTGITARQINDATGTAMGQHYTTHPTQPAVATLDMYMKMAHLLPEPPADIMELMRWRTVESKNMKRREVIGQKKSGITNKAEEPRHTIGAGSTVEVDITAAHTEEAKQWEGWGTALKPAYEPIIIARKPLNGTVADNVLTHGVGGLNIDGCRITDGTETGGEKPEYSANNKNTVYGSGMGGGVWSNTRDRWPTNILHDGCLEGESWSRYFYCAKTSKADRNEGLDHLQAVGAGEMTGGRAEDSDGLKSPRAGAGRTGGSANHHPTVKPTALMRYLCRLVTPPGGVVLDPFAGSGSTGKAAILEGFNPILIEMTPEYWPIIDARCSWACWQRFADD